MKFTWDVKEMKYMNMNGYEREAVAEQYSFTEKQAIIQEQGFFNFNDFWNKYTKFQAEKDTIKSRGTKWNGKPDYYYSSLKAWCKRNGIKTPSYTDSYEWLEFPVFYTGSWTKTCTLRLDNDMNDITKTVNNSFLKMLSELAEKERAWFLEHDEYSILEKEADNYLWHGVYIPKFEMNICFGTQGIFVKGDNDTERKVTLEELKQINEYYHKVEEAIKAVEIPKFTF